MRHELKKRGIQKLKVVYSREPARQPIGAIENDCPAGDTFPPDASGQHAQRRSVPGSNAFVPADAGLIIAGEVVRDLTGV